MKSAYPGRNRRFPCDLGGRPCSRSWHQAARNGVTRDGYNGFPRMRPGARSGWLGLVTIRLASIGLQLRARFFQVAMLNTRPLALVGLLAILAAGRATAQGAPSAACTSRNSRKMRLDGLVRKAILFATAPIGTRSK